MANKPASRNWKDIQMVMAAMTMTLTLGLWNVFARQDLAKAGENGSQPGLTPAAEVPPAVMASPTAAGPIKILLGGQAPQTKVIQQPGARRGGRNNGGSGGGGGAATTRSS
jgi:hypothetical protein